MFCSKIQLQNIGKHSKKSAQKFVTALSQVMETCNGNFTVYSLYPNTSEVYKMKTFSLNSVLEKTFL